MDVPPPVVRRYLDAYNARDVDALVACVTEDIVFENVATGTVTVRTEGRAAFEALARQGAAMFSAREQAVEACIATATRVALRIDFRATVAADLPNGWRAGQGLRLSGASFMRLRDGLIAEIVDES